MTTVTESRTNFGRILKTYRSRRNLTLRQLQELSGVNYTLVSAFEHGERAVGADTAARLAGGLGLAGDERQRFLFAAAATRRKDRLVGYARLLAPELLNFVPKVLAGSGLNLEAIEACEVRQNLEGERPQLLSKLRTAFGQVTRAAAGKQTGDFLVVNTGGREYVCALLIASTA
jgi:transcriptional regulator with XRE-family HTH domain